MLDMRKIHLATYNIQSFPTKAAAKKAALARGYRAACSFGTVRLFFNSVGQLDLVPETI